MLSTEMLRMRSVYEHTALFISGFDQYGGDDPGAQTPRVEGGRPTPHFTSGGSSSVT